jgi:LmbE family N-acetylglucosaminyl deacetylase
MRTLTAVYAHPDDETFSAGGTLAKYSAAGVRCTLLVATDGDAGKTSGLNVSSREELGRLRRTELQKAAAILGVAKVECLGYPDGALGQVDQDELIGRIVAQLRLDRPDVVITFAPEGAPNHHRDHKVISRAATAAYVLSGHPDAGYPAMERTVPSHHPARLFYVTWAAPSPGSQMTARGLPHTAAIDVRDFRDRELAAWRAHASQQAMDKHFQESGATDEELFAFAAGVPQPRALIDDLFEGL